MTLATRPRASVTCGLSNVSAYTVIDNRSSVADPIFLQVGLVPLEGALPVEGEKVTRWVIQAEFPVMRQVTALFDGGADEHVIPLHVVRTHFPSVRIRPPKPHQRSLRGIAGSLPSVGLVDILVVYGNRRFADYFVVVDTDMYILLGNCARAALGLSLDGIPPELPSA